MVVSGEATSLACELQRLANDRDGGAVVDLRKVWFMDTTGVHHLLTLQRRLDRQRRRLTVVCAPGVVYRTLHALGLRESLNVVCPRRCRAGWWPEGQAHPAPMQQPMRLDLS